MVGGVRVGFKYRPGSKFKDPVLVGDNTNHRQVKIGFKVGEEHRPVLDVIGDNNVRQTFCRLMFINSQLFQKFVYHIIRQLNDRLTQFTVPVTNCKRR